MVGGSNAGRGLVRNTSSVMVLMDVGGWGASFMMDVRQCGMNPHRQHNQDHEEVAENPHEPSLSFTGRRRMSGHTLQGRTCNTGAVSDQLWIWAANASTCPKGFKGETKDVRQLTRECMTRGPATVCPGRCADLDVGGMLARNRDPFQVQLHEGRPI